MIGKEGAVEELSSGRVLRRGGAVEQLSGNGGAARRPGIVAGELAAWGSRHGLDFN